MTRAHAIRHALAAADLVVLSDRRRACLQCRRPFVPRELQRFTCSSKCRAAYIADWPHEIDEVPE